MESIIFILLNEAGGRMRGHRIGGCELDLEHSHLILPEEEGLDRVHSSPNGKHNASGLH